MAGGIGLWRSLRWEQVLAPLLAPSIFVEGQPLPSEDIGQAIDYVATWLEDEHLRASAAIPVLFPAVHVSGPPWGTWLVRRLGAQHRWEHW